MRCWLIFKLILLFADIVLLLLLLVLIILVGIMTPVIEWILSRCGKACHGKMCIVGRAKFTEGASGPSAPGPLLKGPPWGKIGNEEDEKWKNFRHINIFVLFFLILATPTCWVLMSQLDFWSFTLNLKPCDHNFDKLIFFLEAHYWHVGIIWAVGFLKRGSALSVSWLVQELPLF